LIGSLFVSSPRINADHPNLKKTSTLSMFRF